LHTRAALSNLKALEPLLIFTVNLVALQYPTGQLLTKSSFHKSLLLDIGFSWTLSDADCHIEVASANRACQTLGTRDDKG
jgi:hypothetical protein